MIYLILFVPYINNVVTFFSIKETILCHVHADLLSLCLLKAHHLISGAELNSAGVDFVQVALNALQIDDTVTTTQLQNQLEQHTDPHDVKQRRRDT